MFFQYSFGVKNTIGRVIGIVQLIQVKLEDIIEWMLDLYPSMCQKTTTSHVTDPKNSILLSLIIRGIQINIQCRRDFMAFAKFCLLKQANLKVFV